jgi:enoyl-CoA hydratase/carnithine racemase
MSQLEEVLRITQQGKVAHLVLNRPEKRNALNDALIEALDRFFVAIPSDVRAVVVSGVGGHFSSGLDLSEHAARTPLDVMAHSRGWHRVMDRIQYCGVPVIAAMSGAVMGGGLEFGATCHVRVAEEAVRFQLPEGLRGIFVGGGGSVRIARLIGPDRMTEMMLTGRIYSGEEGRHNGLCHYVVPDGAALTKAFELAERIAENSRTINSLIIQSIAQIATMPPAAGLFAESLTAALSQSGPDAEEGLRAFLQKRRPTFG